MEDYEKKIYKFKYTFFGNKVQMFSNENCGVVIEKERDVVCVYGTNPDYNGILCAIPLGSPSLFKGLEYVVAFESPFTASVTVGDCEVFIDYEAQKCKNNKHLRMYGSPEWGEDIEM